MKIEELSIGDWVYGFDGKPNPVVISALDIYPYNRTPRIVTYGGYGYQIEHLSPIPLTPEILEKNFGKAERGEFFRDELFDGDEFVELYIREMSDSIWLVRCDNVEFSSIPSEQVIVSNVHQLQHALRLFGIEKEIVL